MPRTLLRSMISALSAMAAALTLLVLAMPASAGETFSVIYNFQPNTDGSAPNPGGAMLQDAAGNLYGETINGGTFDAGSTFAVNSSGTTFSTLYNFGTSASDGRSRY